MAEPVRDEGRTPPDALLIDPTARLQEIHSSELSAGVKRTSRSPPVGSNFPPGPGPKVGGTMDTDWTAQGKCRDMDPAVFFPSDGVGVREAQAICAGCPVIAPCLEYALADRVDHGVWGGTSERERRRILRNRRMVKLQPVRS
jgi:WhiB family transcriptional regulator, redox-sensing transcriptional regulator